MLKDDPEEGRTGETAKTNVWAAHSWSWSAIYPSLPRSPRHPDPIQKLHPWITNISLRFSFILPVFPSPFLAFPPFLCSLSALNGSCGKKRHFSRHVQVVAPTLLPCLFALSAKARASSWSRDRPAGARHWPRRPGASQRSNGLKGERSSSLPAYQQLTFTEDGEHYEGNLRGGQ